MSPFGQDVLVMTTCAPAAWQTDAILSSSVATITCTSQLVMVHHIIVRSLRTWAVSPLESASSVSSNEAMLEQPQLSP